MFINYNFFVTQKSYRMFVFKSVSGDLLKKGGVPYQTEAKHWHFNIKKK